MRSQQQGTRQLIDGSGHIAGDEAGAKPVRGAVGQDELPQFHTGELPRRAPKAMQAIASFRARREQLRSQPEPYPARNVRTHAASCQRSSYYCRVNGMTICLAPRGPSGAAAFR